MLSLFSRKPLTARDKKRRAYHAGVAAEIYVCMYVMCRGYRIVARRMKTPAGEIDIIAKRRRCMVMIEVKYRRNSEHDVPVTTRQILRIKQAAACALRLYGDEYTQLRCDIAVVRYWRIAYMKDAF